MAVLGIIATCCDAVENIFILAMLTDPLGFPNVWAIEHSCFALVKWIIIFSSFAWIFMSGFIIMIKKLK